MAPWGKAVRQTTSTAAVPPRLQNMSAVVQFELVSSS